MSTDLAAPRAAERADPVPPADRREPPVAAAGGVELGRLLALARLTPQQAVVIGAGVLGEAAGRPGPARDPRPVAARLEQIAAAARFPGRRPDRVGDRLLEALDRAVLDLSRTGVATVARELAEEAAGIDRDAVRAELAALARVVPAGTRGGAAADRAPATGGRSAPAAPLETTNRGRRAAGWLLSVVVLAAVVVVEVVVLRGKIATDIGLLLDAGRGGTTSAAAPRADGVPVPAPAPAAAGTVTAVDLRPLAPCAPGGACTLRLVVRLAPRADPQVVTWSYLLVDRCTGATTPAAGGTVAVPPNGEQAVAVGTVALPARPSVAVLAVTGSPAAAASAPVSVGSCRGTG